MMENNVYKNSIQPEDIDQTCLATIEVKTVTTWSSRIRLDINFKREIFKGTDIIASIKDMRDGHIDFCIRQNCGIACLASLSSV